jgi:hypothetical protein
MRTSAKSRALTAVAAFLAACTAPTPHQELDPAPVWVVDDGNHNGILLRCADASLLPRGASPDDFVEYGFSDLRWMQERRLDAKRVWELLVREHQGVLVVRIHGSLEEAQGTRTLRPMRTTRQSLDQLNSEIWRWVQRDGFVEEQQGEPPTFLVESTMKYSLLNNCRAFTARLVQQLAILDLP